MYLYMLYIYISKYSKNGMIKHIVDATYMYIIIIRSSPLDINAKINIKGKKLTIVLCSCISFLQKNKNVGGIL